MTRKRYSPEQIIVMLREAEVLEYKGLTQLEIAKQVGIPNPLAQVTCPPKADPSYMLGFGSKN